MYKCLFGIRQVAVGGLVPIAATRHIPGPFGGVVQTLAIATSALMVIYLLAIGLFACWAVRQRPQHGRKTTVVTYARVER